MAQTTRKKPTASSANKTQSRSRSGNGSTKTPRRREIMAAVCFLLSVFTFIGYSNTDGAFIVLFCGLAKGLVGHGFYALPPALLICSAILTFHRGRPVRYRVICILLLTAIAGGLIHLFKNEVQYDISFRMISHLWSDGIAMSSGGAIGGTFAEVFNALISKTGAIILFICAAVFLLLSAFNTTVAGIVDAIRNRERREYVPEPEPEPREHPSYTQRRMQNTKQKRKKDIDIPIDYDKNEQDNSEFDPSEGDEPDSDTKPANSQKPPRGRLSIGSPRVKTPDQLIAEYASNDDIRIDDTTEVGEQINTDTTSTEIPSNDPDAIEDVPLDIPFMEPQRKKTTKSPFLDTDELPSESQNNVIESNKQNDFEGRIEPIISDSGITYEFPPIRLLTAGTPRSNSRDEDEVRVNTERLESAFKSFGVNVTISNTTRGPAVTRYEAELEAGVKLNKLTSLADDIALSLGASGVRIAAMPNKISTVGIEVPNKIISTVYLRDIIESNEFRNAQSKLTFAIGMDISGDAIIGNIAKLPHMLVAGTTGSGKSVSLNSLILSILYKATPEDVRFIMIDPKMVEFKVYNSIPHLLVPVVTDVKKAAGALQWAVVEMMKRYALFAETNSRDIEGYNLVAAKSEEWDVIPQVIIVIDELADLMMMAAKEVEESVCRVAQMGRAAGMHLIIATQSPRADVITGLMKANIPSRIALKVSSALESRIILDAGGNADKLVGNGDMLYAPIGTTKPMRVQGTWVSDEERENVVGFIKQSGESQYSEEVMGEIEKATIEKSSGDKSMNESGGNDYDELLPQAVDVIFETGQASVSMLQRRLKLGYSRAARIVDQMEQMGIVGPFEGSKPRAMLVTKDQWRQMQYLSGNAPADTPHSSASSFLSIADEYGDDDDNDDDVSFDEEDD